MSWELVRILYAAVESGEVPCKPNDYVIPNRRTATVRRQERSDKVIWETVIRVADRVGVKATTHVTSVGVPGSRRIERRPIRDSNPCRRRERAVS